MIMFFTFLVKTKRKERKMPYIENPKTKGSGVICCIPQEGVCPIGCADCFFQSGRSYLEPLDDNLPNMPSLKEVRNRVVRVNDGNDSNNHRDLVVAVTSCYPQKFFNTSISTDLEFFGDPVVLTVNPGNMTDKSAHFVDPIPKNLMFVRVRVNSWNLDLVDWVVEYYTGAGIPVIFTFMAYYTETIPDEYKDDYVFSKRTLNSYWVITSEAWDRIMSKYSDNQLVYSCGKNADTHACSRCGNCLREYFATMERMKTKEE
jgi:hypothetical protein